MTLDGEHAVQYTEDLLQNCTPNTYVTLLTVTPINLIKIFKGIDSLLKKPKLINFLDGIKMFIVYIKQKCAFFFQYERCCIHIFKL